jgi:hypothetical protein
MKSWYRDPGTWYSAAGSIVVLLIGLGYISSVPTVQVSGTGQEERCHRHSLFGEEIAMSWSDVQTGHYDPIWVP